MPLVVPNAGEVKLLEYLVNAATPDDLVIHLYESVSATSPVNLSGGLASEAIIASSFASFVPPNAGYPDTGKTLTSVVLGTPQWVVESDAQGISSASYTPGVTFTFEAGASASTIWGYYVTNDAGGVVNNRTCLWAEEFSGAPFILPAGGGQIAIKPQIQLD